MSRTVRSVIVVEALMLALIGSIQVTYAAPRGYIDPNTGGMLFQILAVVVTMASGFVFLFSNKIKMLFNRGKNVETTADDSSVLLTQLDDVVVDDEEEKKAEIAASKTVASRE